jgi:uncharacterized protein YjbI with pentapeptide repeats
MSAPDEQPGPAESSWGTRPTEQRQAELEKRLREWESEGDQSDRRDPFTDEALNGADVFWLAICAYRAYAETDESEAERSLRTIPSGLSLSLSFNLSALHLEWAVLERANLERANLAEANMGRTSLRGTNLKGADLRGANLEGADLKGANLEGAILHMARLGGANLAKANLQGADLSVAELEDTIFHEAQLGKADLTLATFDRKSSLDDACLNHVTLANVIFDNTDLTGVHWGKVRKLGDELRVGTDENRRSRGKPYNYRVAARTYRALSVVLRNQGINDAARFHYRSEVMERKALWWDATRQFRSWSFYRAPLSFALWFVSWVLGFFTGYGHYISRLFLTYAGIVVAFAAIYLGVIYQPVKGHRLATFPWPQTPAPISWLRGPLSFCLVRLPAAIGDSSLKHSFDMLAFSVTAFHGRGLQILPGGQQTPNDYVIWWAGVEAVLGLLIEALFVAAFARRVTGG